MNLKQRILELKNAVVAMQLALRHPATPWYAKVCGACTLFYALSPLDLIPDFIPIIGLLDDLVLLPLGLWLTIRMLPPAVWQECRAEAARRALAQPAKSWRGTVLLICLKLLILGSVTYAVWSYFFK